MKKFLVAISLVILVGLAGCGNNSTKSNTVSSVSLTQKSKKKATTKRKANIKKIKIRVNGHVLKAHLNNSSAGRAFAKRLPTTLTFVDFPGSNPEKMADLNYSLPTKGMPAGHAGNKGTIGYWSPDRRIIFYYGHVDYFPGIHIIGKFDSKNYVKVIKGMKNNTKVTFSIAK